MQIPSEIFVDPNSKALFPYCLLYTSLTSFKNKLKHVLSAQRSFWEVLINICIVFVALGFILLRLNQQFALSRLSCDDCCIL